ncbi:stress response protein NST1 [Dendroctonus ponderosae]|uniref:Uncharacterized protein n=1 Tax=Dendroctonus ponderosae TaxID=77166 RepID=A0AAR5PBZ0_DENPD|nr:stress response protein NST1 [Dendroctonus ponderosae]KAH1007127.1 hypothetical protein HUJ04_004400 [Dendroctonus ponderosae]KAH1014608.1 hypothetical protein HUJ05_012457 [Dendroctonus ponderosae]
MSKIRDRRLRFSIEQDLQLLREVIRQNPFEEVDRWTKIHENFVNECNVPFSLRTCKEHATHLLNLHLKDALKVRPRETDDDFAEKKKYLDQIVDIRRQFGLEKTSRRGSRHANSWEEEFSTSTVKKELTRFVKEEDSDDDFYWDEENEREKKEKEREAKSTEEKERDSKDVEGKLRKQALALAERKLALRTMSLKLEEEKLELDMLERTARLEMERAEREAYRQVAMHNQSIITALMDRYNRGNGGNNLCIL